MKVFSLAALVAMASVGMARELYLEHPGALKTIAKREIHALSKRQGQNLATFTGALGGIEATPITCSGNQDRQFQVKGDTFVNFAAAAQRSCDQQQNACSNAANAGGTDFSVSDCQAQQQQCNAAQTAAAGSCSGAAAANGAADNTGAAASNGAANNAGAAASNGAADNTGSANTGKFDNPNAGATGNANAGASTGSANAGASTATNCGSAKRRRNIHGVVKA